MNTKEDDRMDLVDRCKKVVELEEQIGKYWDLAYQEGKEGRTADNESGEAGLTWLRITGLIDEVAFK